MKIRTIVAIASGIALVSVTAGPASAAPLPPKDVSTHSVTCDTTFGFVKFAVPLTLTGPLTGANNATTMNLTLDGCVDDNDAYDTNSNPDGVLLGQSKGKGVLTSGSANCTALLGVNPVTTTDPILIKWKGLAKGPDANNPGLFIKLPKLTSDAVGDPEVLGRAYTQLSVTEIAGGLYTPQPGGGIAWGATAQYGLFQFGADADHQNTAAPSSTGAFGGAGNGAGTTLDGVTSASAAALLGPCTAKGLKKVVIGLGQSHFG